MKKQYFELSLEIIIYHEKDILTLSGEDNIPAEDQGFNKVFF